jgi:hypothetical protein
MACALILGFASLGSVSAADNKVDICHFQERNDSWKLITVRERAVEGHLENHDDALPGKTTSQTGTVLDANCVEVTCPCDFSLSAGESIFSEPQLSCYVDFPDIGVTQVQPLVVEPPIDFFVLGGDLEVCYTINDGFHVSLPTEVDATQKAKCRADILATVASLSIVQCP